MFAKARTIALAASASVAIFVLPALAQVSAIQQQLVAYKAVSQELISLYTRVKDKATSTAVAAQVDAAVKKRSDIVAKLNAAMQKIDPKNQKDGKILESAFSEIQSLSKKVNEAHYQATTNAKTK